MKLLTLLMLSSLGLGFVACASDSEVDYLEEQVDYLEEQVDYLEEQVDYLESIVLSYDSSFSELCDKALEKGREDLSALKCSQDDLIAHALETGEPLIESGQDWSDTHHSNNWYNY